MLILYPQFYWIPLLVPTGFVELLRFSIFMIMLTSNTNNLTSSFVFWMPFFFFSFFIALARTSSTLLNRSGENRHSCLIQDWLWWPLWVFYIWPLLCWGKFLIWPSLVSSGKEYACRWRRHGFSPWIRKIPWRRKWQLTSVFLPRKSHGQRSLMDCSPWGCKESDTT